jgi:hypothetical protein
MKQCKIQGKRGLDMYVRERAEAGTGARTRGKGWEGRLQKMTGRLAAG